MLNLLSHVFDIILLFCFGRAGGTMEGFVVMGQDTDMSQYPHSAFLEAKCKEAGRWICGAAILNQKLLLTAAHCVDECNWVEDSTARLITLVGHENLHNVSIKRRIINVQMHPDFDGVSMANDVAVAVVHRELPLGPGVKRVIITEEYPEGVDYGYVAGWGLIKEDSEESSTVLKDVKQMITSRETCSLVGKLHDGMFCAGTTEKGKPHPARGDSGSALVTVHKIHQIGIVSFCIRRYPGLMVYTNVSYYYEWIFDNAHELYCSYN